VISYLKEKLSKEHEQVNIMDGVRVDLANGWGLIRASNTSPLVRVTVEADSNESLRELIDFFETEYTKALEKVTS
jgi:phosphomannomutase